MKKFIGVFFCIFLSTVLLTSCMFTDRRGVSTVWSDDEISEKIYYDISRSLAENDISHINIDTYNHKVLLTGQVPNAGVKDQLAQLANNTQNVQKIYNEVTIGPTTGLTQRSHDTWITTHVKSLMTASNNNGLMGVKVTTENNVVYLMGLVTPEEAELATEKARSVKGVKEVVKLFDFVN
ncbi:MAG: BON domain-containing protein [Gammaproteobacteria bacterium]